MTGSKEADMAKKAIIKREGDKLYTLWFAEKAEDGRRRPMVSDLGIPKAFATENGARRYASGLGFEVVDITDIR